LKDAAIADPPPPGAAHFDPTQFDGEPLQISNLALDFFEMAFRNVIDRGAAQPRLSRKTQEITELIKREPEVAAASNESQPIQMFQLVSAVIILRSWRRWHEVDPFVVPDGYILDPRPPR
jgi:hypothetical protein